MIGRVASVQWPDLIPFRKVAFGKDKVKMNIKPSAWINAMIDFKAMVMAKVVSCQRASFLL